MKVLRWLLAASTTTILAVACDRADRDVGDYDVGEPTAATAGRNPDAAGGADGEGGAGAVGTGAVGGGFGGATGSFCEEPGALCQDCVQCELQGSCGVGLNECEGFQDCALAMQCLRDCYATCTSNTPGCIESCETSCGQEPGFNQAIDTLDCFCRLSCPNACATDQVSGCVGFLP